MSRGIIKIEQYKTETWRKGAKGENRSERGDGKEGKHGRNSSYVHFSKSTVQ